MLSNVCYTIKNHVGQDGNVFPLCSSLDGALKGGNAPPFHDYLAILNEEYFSDRKSNSCLMSFESISGRINDTLLYSEKTPPSCTYLPSERVYLL